MWRYSPFVISFLVCGWIYLVARVRYKRECDQRDFEVTYPSRTDSTSRKTSSPVPLEKQSKGYGLFPVERKIANKG